MSNSSNQRKRDDNKNKICVFSGGGGGRGAERKMVQNAIFHGKRHDNKILKVKILLSRRFVVMAQAPKKGFPCNNRFPRTENAAEKKKLLNYLRSVVRAPPCTAQEKGLLPEKGFLPK